MEYFKPVEHFMRLFNPEQHAYFNKLSKESHDTLEEAFLAAKKLSTLDDVIEIYGILGKIQFDLDIMLNIIKNPYYFDMLSVGLSDAHHQRIVQVKFDIMMQNERLKQQIAREDVGIFTQLVDSLDLPKNYESVLMQLSKHTSPNRLIIYIIKRTLQVADCEHLIIGKLEKFKDVILGTQQCDVSGMMQTSESSMEWIVPNRGLFPVTPYEDASKALKDVGIEHSADRPVSQSLGDSGKYVVVINKGYGREIDFNYLTVLDDEYIAANDLYTKRTSGVNKKISKRFNVISPVEIKPLGDKILTEYGARQPQCVVLETPNGEQYRRLGIRYGDKSVDSGIIDRIKQGVGMRALAYQEIMEFYVLNRGGEAQRDRIVQWYDEKKTDGRSTEGMKSAMLAELISSFKPPAEPNVDNFTSEIRDNYVKIVTKHVVKYLGNDRFMGREAKITFVAKIADVMREFNRNLNSSIRKNLHPGLFTARADMAKHLLDVYSDVMRDTINAVDAAPSKWQSTERSLKEYYRMHKFAD